MSTRLFLSILIPTLNEEAWIAHCVRTVRASMRACDVRGEIVVCDGGSTDETVRRARDAGADVVVECEVSSRARQLERGRDRTRGDVLVFLHADALASPDWIEAIVEASRRGCVGGWSPVELVAEDDGFAGLYGLPAIAAGINLRTHLFETATADQGIFVRRSVLDSIGGIPEVPLLEGNLLARRLRRAGRVALLPTPLRISGRRWERGGIVRTTLTMYAIRIGFWLGVEPRRLARLWREWSTTS